MSSGKQNKLLSVVVGLVFALVHFCATVALFYMMVLSALGSRQTAQFWSVVTVVFEVLTFPVNLFWQLSKGADQVFLLASMAANSILWGAAVGIAWQPLRARWDAHVLPRLLGPRAPVDAEGATNRSAVSRWLDRGDRRAFVRVFALIVGLPIVCFGLLWLDCKRADGPLIQRAKVRASSPDGHWLATAYEYGYRTYGREHTNSDVRLWAVGAGSDRRNVLWKSNRVSASALEWKGTDSVLVHVEIVPYRDGKELPEQLSSIKTYSVRGISARTVVKLVKFQRYLRTLTPYETR
jgi:hypothetical protein